MESLNNLVRRLNTCMLNVLYCRIWSITFYFCSDASPPPIVNPIDSYSPATVYSPRSTHLALIFYQFRRIRTPSVHRLLGEVRSKGSPNSALQDVRFRVPISVYFFYLNTLPHNYRELGSSISQIFRGSLI